MIPKLVFVGGFLGAGKTTLILKAAQIVQNRGQRVALIMNDQDSELVDTQFARTHGFETNEVSGGCFCCRFSDLLEQSKKLLAYRPDVIFAEPVGSCIDLAATILQPLRAFHKDVFVTAPLTVLVDPDLAEDVMAGKVPPEVSYLFNEQIQEADIVCTTKADLYPIAPQLPFPVDFHISSRSGRDMEAWLQEVMTGNRTVGARLLGIDYQEYADAEAALGWVNAHASCCLRKAVGPAAFIGPFLDDLDECLTGSGIKIAHLKLFDQTLGGYLVATIRKNGQEPDPQGDMTAEPSLNHDIAINLRALGDAELLQSIVEQALSRVDGSVKIRHLRAFHPLPPKPEYRFQKALQA
jgi:Ni2+-binding GTPase involved in maturation of urease and hydrogenase